MTEFVKVAGVETPIEVAQILNKIIDEKGNVDLDNLSEVGEKRFSDLTSSITNVKNSVSSLTTTVNGKIGATVSKATNGYIKFTNGMIIQWGLLSNTTLSEITVVLPISYNESYSAIVSDWSSPNYGDSVYALGVRYNNKTVSSFTVDFYKKVPRGFGYITVGF